MWGTADISDDIESRSQDADVWGSEVQLMDTRVRRRWGEEEEEGEQLQRYGLTDRTAGSSRVWKGAGMVVVRPEEGR